MQTSRSSRTETPRLLAAKPSCMHAHKAKGALQHRLQAKPCRVSSRKRRPHPAAACAANNHTACMVQPRRGAFNSMSCMPQDTRSSSGRAHVCVARECLLIVCSLVNKSTVCRSKSACSASTCTLETLSQPLPTLVRLHRYYLSTGAGYCLSTKHNHSLRKAYRQTHRLRVHPAISTQSQVHTTSCMQHSMDASHAEQCTASKQADKAMQTHNE